MQTGASGAPGAVARPERLFPMTVAGLVALNVIVQNYNLGRTVIPGLDEGIYLYAAKLIANGAVPYRDFFLSHPPLLFLFASSGLVVTGFDMNLFHFLYTLWFFSLLFPVCFIARALTGSAAGGLVAGLCVSTFTELVQWDARSFALRQASLPFLAFALFFVYVRPRPALAGLLLALFALSVVSNVLIAGAWLAALALEGFRTESVRGWLSRHGRLLAVFLATTATGYALTLALPRAFDDLVLFQAVRRFQPYAGRFESILHQSLKFNAPILALGLIGSFVASCKARFFGVTNLLGGLLIVLGARSFYPNYLSILAVSLAISGAILTSTIARSRPVRALGIPYLAEGLVASVLLVNAFFFLRGPLLRMITPDFYEVVDVVRRSPGPLLAFEPRIALYAGTNLTPHYYVADAKFFRAMGRDLDEGSFQDLLARSGSVVVEPYLASFLDRRRWETLAGSFTLVFRRGAYQVWVKKTP